MAEKKLTLKGLNDEIVDLYAKIELLQASLERAHTAIADIKPRDRGPASTRTMTEEDATRLIKGDLAKVAHKDAATTLGLSYGQVYSARGGYTFKHLQN